MSIDFDQFKDTFITESFELLEEMEERLLCLDEGDVDLDEVNAIFRCAHSIKGGGGAFGFSRLVNFTHILEALLDSMRDGKMDATQDVIDTLLQSVDVVNGLIKAAQEGNEAPQGYEEELATKLGDIVSSSGAVLVNASTPEFVDKVNQSAHKEVEMFGILFVPKKSLFASGNEPLLILRELSRAGEMTCVVDISEVPGIFDIDPEDCYLKWTIDVSTEGGEDLIKEAFEFVDDECDLTIESFGAISVASPSGEDDFENDDFAGLFGDDDAVVNESLAEPVKKEEKAKISNAKPPAAAQQQSTSSGVSSIRVDIHKVDDLVNMVGELVITQAMILNQTKDLPQEQFQSLLQGVEELARHTRELQESVMAVRMQPVKSVFARMPRIVRDLSRQLGKDIQIEMVGENTEIDKTVIEQLGDPLTHMIRNSVDHGIETPDVREANGKLRQGTIRLSADNTGGRILIEVGDDGGGVDRERVLKKAIEKGLFPADVQLSDEEVDNIIFMAGFSTAEAVTDVSGRGVGMDVVRRNIESLGGTIEINNVPGKGSNFVVSLPLTLAILDGMIVQVGSEEYIIPINNILESVKPTKDDIKNISDGSDVIKIREEYVPIIYLHEIFNVSDAKKSLESVLIIIVESGRDKYGLVVDSLVGQQQVVIKSIEENAQAVEGVSGATILGDGKVSLILDVAQMQKMSAKLNNKNSVEVA